MRATRGDGLLTTSQAAQLVGRRPGTVYSWVSRGWLLPDGLDERGRPLYSPKNVRAVELQVRDRGIEASGIDPRLLCRGAA